MKGYNWLTDSLSKMIAMKTPNNLSWFFYRRKKIFHLILHYEFIGFITKPHTSSSSSTEKKIQSTYPLDMSFLAWPSADESCVCTLVFMKSFSCNATFVWDVVILSANRYVYFFPILTHRLSYYFYVFSL